MQQRIGKTEIQNFFKDFQTRYGFSRCAVLLSVFLLVILFVSFIIPILHFGRFFGTDDYTHLMHTEDIASSSGMSDFYQSSAAIVSNPGSGENGWNYPFGIWLFGSIIVKITGIPLLTAELIFVILFLFILLGSFYFYSGTFLESREQKLLAVLFLVSMPSAAIALLAYRPSVFVLPFLFILLYVALQDTISWKLLPFSWLSIFIITISHTGSFIFLLVFSILFFLLYCLFWGKLSYSMYSVILSTFLIYIITLMWFPEIGNQYSDKARLLLSPGRFLAQNINFSLPSELSKLFYQNVIVNQEFVYTIIFGALIFSLGLILRFIHRNISARHHLFKQVYPVTLPITNISHSFAAAPIWMGPMHTILSFIGFFRIDRRGKCMLISALLVTLVPDILQTSSGVTTTTGATREISFLIIIIPITTVLGFWAVISYLNTIEHPQKNVFYFIVWALVLLAIIIPPSLATTYYLPKIAGENYIINGMKWLGGSGDPQEKVIGYGYRTVPIYTNMSGPGLKAGSDTGTFLRLLRGTLFSSDESSVTDLRNFYGMKYVLVSDKVVGNLGRTRNDLVIDDNQALNKIYASQDFGIYEIIGGSEQSKENKILPGNISLEHSGTAYLIKTDAYSVILKENNPALIRFGTQSDNSLGGGFVVDYLTISGFRQGEYVNPYLPPDDDDAVRNSTADLFLLNNIVAPSEIENNQIIYKKILKDKQSGENEATLLVRYTFYPTTVKREFLISHDWITTPTNRYMNVRFTTQMFVPLNDFIINPNTNPVKRHSYPTQDSATLKGIIHDLYLYNSNRDRGIYVKIEPTERYPTSMTYSGSTVYDMTNYRFAQAATLKSGMTMHVTQFLSPNDVVTAEKNIHTQQGISLLNYPNGITPIIFSGYRSAYSDTGSTNNTEKGYDILINQSVPYSEIIVPRQVFDTPVVTSKEVTPTSEILASPIETIPTVSPTRVPKKIDLQEIANKNIKIIGSGSTGSKGFDNFSEQESSISSLIEYVNNENIALIGYMPGSLDYNLDTVKILSDKKIPFMISNTISPPIFGRYGLDYKDPQMARYHSEAANVTMLPISSFTSDDLSTYGGNTELFSAWNASIDEAASTDGMAYFVIRARHIGISNYSDDFDNLITSAKNKGLTFTTPDVIADYFNEIQNIRYSGSLEGDMASINLTNNNDNMVRGITFRIVLPALRTGGYNVSRGTVVKTIEKNNNIIVYVSTDISAHASQDIWVEPGAPRDKLNVTIPQNPIEGRVPISITDPNGSPLKDVDVIIDAKYYQPDTQGNVYVDLPRGIHNLQIQYPGYEKYSTTLDVKGRINLIEQLF